MNKPLVAASVSFFTIAAISGIVTVCNYFHGSSPTAALSITITALAAAVGIVATSWQERKRGRAEIGSVTQDRREFPPQYLKAEIINNGLASSSSIKVEARFRCPLVPGWESGDLSVSDCENPNPRGDGPVIPPILPPGSSVSIFLIPPGGWPEELRQFGEPSFGAAFASVTGFALVLHGKVTSRDVAGAREEKFCFGRALDSPVEWKPCNRK